VFGSDPAKFLPRRPRIYTCTKCFGFHHVDKCRYNPVCGECGGQLRDHRQHKLIPQCPNCLGPFTPGHQDCPTKPKVLQGRVVKPTKEQRSSIRKAGRAAYKTKLAESRNAQDATPSPSDPMEAEPSAADTSRPPSPEAMVTTVPSEEWRQRLRAAFRMATAKSPLNEVIAEAQRLITNRNCDARDFIDFLSSGRLPSPEQGRPGVAQLPWDSPEGIAILDEWQHIRRETAPDERQHIRGEPPARRPVRTRGLAQPPTDGTIQPLRAATAPLSSHSPPSQNPSSQSPDRPPTPIGDTIFVRY